MLDFEFIEAAGLLHCKFRERMDSIRSTQATAMLNDKLADLGHPAATADAASIVQGLSSPVNRIVFDLELVDYISSGFLRLCMLAAKQVQEGSFRIVNTKPQVMKVFKISCLDESLQIS